MLVCNYLFLHTNKFVRHFNQRSNLLINYEILCYSLYFEVLILKFQYLHKIVKITINLRFYIIIIIISNK